MKVKFWSDTIFIAIGIVVLISFFTGLGLGLLF
ncbi:hypothetical protein STG2_124 [Salmonella phage STG2]|uniref:Uncharacterized protein n=1 Tax=Salmonella phage STG2 TaxID=2480623 RepID=A0A3G2KAS4_9CAUD|nr:hypothetical protein HOU44_gp111 [Salmonella phage STG2]AYN56088.1 hypothetical protein STG2_124 [Salmonella phage STG2]